MAALELTPKEAPMHARTRLTDKEAKHPADDRELTAQALATPWDYARVKLGFNLHPKQDAVLHDLYPAGSRVLFRCGNEVGKTSTVATAAILHHCEIMGGLVVSTAGVSRQVKHQLIPNLKRFSHLYPGWRFTADRIIDAHGRERYLGFTAANQGNFQGFHNLDGPLMIILDESAAIKDDIALAAEERCNPTRMLIMGSPLDPVGFFYQYATSLSRFYKQHKLTQPECHWLDKEYIQRKIDKWGVEHPIVLSSVFADFSLKVENALLSLREWDACLDASETLAHAGTERHVFLDFAAGRDENAIGVRVGNKVWLQKAWREKNTMAAIGTFISELNKLKREIGLRPEEVEGDADGMGIVFCDALAEANWPVLKFHGGSKPRFSDDYATVIAEVWTEGTTKIRKCELILPRDEELKGQLISRKSKRDSKGKMTLEAKEDMAKRGIPSPDRADAILGAAAPCPMSRSRNIMGHDDDLAQRFVEQIEGGAAQELDGPVGGYFG